MIDKIKTVVLWVMILTSVTLTWLLWTYQPAYQELEETPATYVEIEDLGETRALSEVIQPREIVIHNQDETMLIHPMEDIYREILEELEEINVDYMHPAGTDHAPSLDYTFTGVEFVFDLPLQSDWLDRFLTVEDENLPVSQVERIRLVNNPSNVRGSEVLIQFVDIENERIYEADTSFSVSRMEDLYNDTEEHQTAVAKHVFDENEESRFQHVRYMPAEPISMRQYTYESTDLSPQSFVQILFPDPEFVERYVQNGNEETLSDGSRVMNLRDNGSLMNYARPESRGAVTGELPHIMEEGLDFINNHSGWTNNYFADDWGDTDWQDNASFRLHIGGYPVLSSNYNNNQYYMIDVVRSGDSTQYSRPMFQLGETPFETDTNVTLPAFSELEDHINTNEPYGLQDVEDLRIGHHMLRQRSFATFEPSWYVKVDGRWNLLDFSSSPDREVNGNGLE